jgi:hypothetical protein
MNVQIQGAIKVLLTLGRLHISTGDIATLSQKLLDICVQEK